MATEGWVPGNVVLTDIQFIHAENLEMEADERQYSIAAAYKAIHQTIAIWQPDYSNVLY